MCYHTSTLVLARQLWYIFEWFLTVSFSRIRTSVTADAFSVKKRPFIKINPLNLVFFNQVESSWATLGWDQFHGREDSRRVRVIPATTCFNMGVPVSTGLKRLWTRPARFRAWLSMPSSASWSAMVKLLPRYLQPVGRDNFNYIMWLLPCKSLESERLVYWDCRSWLVCQAPFLPP